MTATGSLNGKPAPGLIRLSSEARWQVAASLQKQAFKSNNCIYGQDCVAYERQTIPISNGFTQETARHYNTTH